MTRELAMRRSAASESVVRGSASAAVAAFKVSSCAMPSSSAIATRTMSRPSSERPMVNTRTRAEAAARARQYAYALAESTSSPAAPGMRPRNARGEGRLADAGRYETQGDVKRGSVVAFAISSADPGSAVSGAMVDCAKALADDKRRGRTSERNLIAMCLQKPAAVVALSRAVRRGARVLAATWPAKADRKKRHKATAV